MDLPDWVPRRETALSGSEALVYAALLRYRTRGQHWELDPVWPGQDRLAEDAKCSTATVRRALAALVKHGLVRVDPVRTSNGVRNEYRVWCPESRPASLTVSAADLARRESARDQKIEQGRARKKRWRDAHRERSPEGGQVVGFSGHSDIGNAHREGRERSQGASGNAQIDARGPANRSPAIKTPACPIALPRNADAHEDLFEIIADDDSEVCPPPSADDAPAARAEDGDVDHSVSETEAASEMAEIRDRGSLTSRQLDTLRDWYIHAHRVVPDAAWETAAARLGQDVYPLQLRQYQRQTGVAADYEGPEPGDLAYDALSPEGKRWADARLDPAEVGEIRMPAAPRKHRAPEQLVARSMADHLADWGQ